MSPKEREKLLARATVAKREGKQLDFKGHFDTSSAESWCEIVKDVIAFSNSGGGIIIFGVANDGAVVQVDHAAILAYDPADITNKLFRYTNVQFADFELVEVSRGGVAHSAILISASAVPISFTKPGTYDVGGGKQKTAFSQGTVYFRHGAKSEPGHHEDFSEWRDREIDRVRRSWVKGMRKIAEIAPSQGFEVVAGAAVSPGIPITAKISAEPSATHFIPANAGEIWPHRRSAVIKKVNAALPRGKRINGYDIQCVGRVHDVLSKHPEFAYKPHPLNSPQYSEAYVDWLIEQFSQDPEFFSKMRL